MRIIWSVSLTALFAITLAGCSGGPVTEQSPAGVEDRQPTAAGAQTQPVKPGQVSSVT